MPAPSAAEANATPVPAPGGNPASVNGQLGGGGLQSRDACCVCEQAAFFSFLSPRCVVIAALECKQAQLASLPLGGNVPKCVWLQKAVSSGVRPHFS